MVALVWLGGFTWNRLSNRNDLSAAEVEGILSTRTFAARCEPTQRLWPFARHWDYRCEFFTRQGSSILAPLTEAPFAVALVRVSEHEITARTGRTQLQYHEPALGS